MVDTEPETGGNYEMDQYIEISEDDSGDRSVKSYYHGARAPSAATNSGDGLARGEDMNEVRGELGLGLDVNIATKQGNGNQGVSASNGQDHPIINQTRFIASPPPVSPYLPNIWKANFKVPSQFSGEMQRATDIFMSVSVCAPVNMQKISELAHAAAAELLKKATSGRPLWEFDNEGKNEVLNKFEYMKEFGTIDLTLDDIMKMVEVRPTQGLPNMDGNNEEDSFGEFGSSNSNSLFPNNEPNIRGGRFETEASRAYVFTRMNPLNVVEMLMDVDQWSSVFSSMVGRGLVLGIGSTGRGDGKYNEALQVVSSEFHFLSPLVQNRECVFARYCKQLDQCSWLVVDVSLESIFPDQSNTYHRKPSGCLIQMFPNGFTRVIWVEHVEVDYCSVPFAFKPLLTSGFAFSAKRWILTLLRQFKRLVTIMGLQTNPSYDQENCKVWREVPEVGRANLLKLSERMMRSFCLELGSSDARSHKIWRTIQGHEDVRVATRHYIDDPTPGNPQKTTILFTTSIWLPVPQKRLFTFLRDSNYRSEWDLLSSKHNVREVGYIMHGEDPGNRVSILEAKRVPSNEISILYLQESYTHVTGSYVVYAPIECATMAAILTRRSDADSIAILPSGFVIFPDRPTVDEDEVIGSVLTLGFHIVDGEASMGHISSTSMSIIQKLLAETVNLIKSAIVEDDNSSNSQAVMRRNAVKRRRKKHIYK